MPRTLAVVCGELTFKGTKIEAERPVSEPGERKWFEKDSSGEKWSVPRIRDIF